LFFNLDYKYTKLISLKQGFICLINI